MPNTFLSYPKKNPLSIKSSLSVITQLNPALIIPHEYICKLRIQNGVEEPSFNIASK